jgi:small conductance mechanosensitive channel
MSMGQILDAVKRAASGILLMVFRPFKVGDMVVANGIAAKVHEIDLFTTSVDTPDNRRLIIPNSVIAGHTIENVTYHPLRRVDVPVGVAYSADMDETRATLFSAIDAISDSIVQNEEQKSQVVLLGLGASAVDWKVKVWAKTDEFSEVRDRLVYSVKSQLDARGIPIAFSQLDLHRHQVADNLNVEHGSKQRQSSRRSAGGNSGAN